MPFRFPKKLYGPQIETTSGQFDFGDHTTDRELDITESYLLIIRQYGRKPEVRCSKMAGQSFAVKQTSNVGRHRRRKAKLRRKSVSNCQITQACLKLFHEFDSDHRWRLVNWAHQGQLVGDVWRKRPELQSAFIGPRVKFAHDRHTGPK